ncbi:MAG: hypothetical protein IPO92_16080 [Saprospiraceae bacterium]|nr:hypothetical protein [Saprospiraceae bacterium]
MVPIFWFDLLKKLVSIRSAGVKPEEKTQTKPDPTATAQLVSDGLHIDNFDPVDIAIAENRKYWECLPGVIGINKSKKANTVQIVSENSEEIKKIIKDSVELKDSKLKIDIEHLQGEKAKLLSNKRGFIYATNEGNRGTIAGRFYNTKTEKECYLTCAHVVQQFESGHFDINNSEVKIIGSGKTIGNVTNLIRSSFIDAAVIDANKVEIPKEYDVEKICKIGKIDTLTNEQNENIFFKSSGIDKPIVGALALSSFSYTFDTNKYMYRMFLIKHNNDGNSEGGDSGSLLYVYENPKDLTSKKLAIGILIGSASIDSNQYSLGIQLSDICDALFISSIC